jgi:hypothetical protein
VPTRGDVDFSAPSGSFTGTLNVELTTTIANAQIRYTTNGQAPSSSSTSYSEPIQLKGTTRLRAGAFVDGTLSGTPSTALYIARATEASHDLPVLVLDSYGSGKLPTDYNQPRPFVDVAVLAYDVPDSGTVSLSDVPTLASLAAFHVRGNSSSMFDKLPYRLELRNENGGDRDCPLIGMPAESDWALVGPHADKTLVHNNFVYELGREMGLAAPRIKLAEVYVNVDNQPLAADDYQGVYQIVETIKNQKNRLDLKQLDETKTAAKEITGGYIFKFDWMLSADVTIDCPTTASNCWHYLELIDPVPIAPAQKTYLTEHLVAFNAAVRSASPANATTGYPAYIETQSFIDTLILNELTRNMDGLVRSQFFYKDRDQKINAGPLWDFDLIAGVGLNPGMMAGTMANTAADGWQYEGNASRMVGGGSGGFGTPSDGTADWFPKLLAEPTFKSQLVTRWKALRQGLLSDAAMNSRIDSVSQGLSNAAERNFKKWSILSQARVNPFDTPTEATWAAQIAFMKSWLQKRAAWLDTQWK